MILRFERGVVPDHAGRIPMESHISNSNRKARLRDQGRTMPADMRFAVRGLSITTTVRRRANAYQSGVKFQ